MNRPRGRPRQYDPDEALEAAMQLFWTRGLTATSLDDLARATGMNRPSLYNAFGDKEMIYRRSMARFAAQLETEVGDRLADEPDLAQSLRKLYGAALDVYCGGKPARGCFAFCTAPVEAVMHTEVRRDVKRLLGQIDRMLTTRFRRAQDDGQFPASRAPEAAAKLAQAVLHSLALRSRLGKSKASLVSFADEAVEMICRAA